MKNKFGLLDTDIEAITSVLSQQPKVDKAYLFGSRAKGNYKNGSDIDLALKGRDLDFDTLSQISYQLNEETTMPYKFDVLNYHSIKEPVLIDHIDRVGIELYSRWKEVKLGKFTTVINGYAFKSTDFLDNEKPNTLPIIKIKNVANGDVNLDGVHHHFYSENLKKYVVENNDILISLTGNHPELETQLVGLVSKFKLDKKAFLNQRVAKLLSNNFKELDNEYLYYFLKNKDTHQYLASQSSGSANQANISKADIENIPVLLPPIEEQNSISTVLSSLDDKIDLLNRQNKTLEQLAETLFRQWFVEDAEESISLGELAKVSTGKGLKRSEFVENGTYPILGANGEIGRTNNYLTEEKLILTGRVGTLGEVKISSEKVWISDNVLIINPNEGKFFYPIYFSLSRIDFENMNVGSTQPLVTQTDLKKIELKLPSDIKIKKFAEDCNLYFNKINNNQSQIRTLTQTRDNLLPKLMSGEVRVKIEQL